MEPGRDDGGARRGREYPYFPFRLRPASGADSYEVQSHRTPCPLRLNAHAAEVLREADGEAPLEEIVRRLERRYPVDAEQDGVQSAGAAARRLLDELAGRGLVWWRRRALELVPVGPPDTLFLELTAACNLRCRHCVAGSGGRLDGELATERLLELATELARLGVRCVAFSGGEPLVHPDFRRIAEHARAQGLALQLSTNGTLVTPELARWLREREVDVQVSLDGSTAAIHERLRPHAGAHRAALRGIEALVAADHALTIGTVASTANREDVPAIVRLAERLGAARFRLIPFVPCGRGAEHAKLELSVAALEDLHRRLRELRGRVGIEIARLEFEDLTGPESGDPRPRVGLGCGGARTFATITPTGELLPCHFFAGVRADRVDRAPFEAVWRRSRFLNYFRHLAAEELQGACARCALLARCRGGCRAPAFARGDLLGAHPGCWLSPDVRAGARAPSALAGALP